MGYAKQLLEESYQLHNFNTTEFICGHHLDDDFIKSQILKEGVKGTCSYCGNNNRKVVELSVALKLIVTGLNHLYEDANECRYYNKEGEHGFDGDTMLFYNIWFDDALDLRIDESKLFEDIYEYLNNDLVYCRKDEYSDETDYLNSLWDLFKVTVKHKARFVFHFKDQFTDWMLEDPVNILDRVQYTIVNANLFRIVDVNQKLFRCRQHKLKKEVDKEGKSIAAAPTHLSKLNNRMSPAGISMFYCSPYKEVSIAEVVDLEDKQSPFYTTAYFKSKKELKLVDLTIIPDFPSIFDEKNNHKIDTLRFLKDFVKDISNPIHKNDEVIDYVPTQIVTEYIRFNPDLNIDGIVYPSAKIKGKENYVLFMDNEESLEKLIFYPNSIKINQIVIKNPIPML
jgi:hypothetical protein